MSENINVESVGLGCYKVLMPRQSKEKRSALLGAMVTPAVKDFVEQIATKEDRSLSYIGGLFMLKGIEAYLKDKKLKLDKPLVLPNATEVDAPEGENSHVDEKSA